MSDAHEHDQDDHDDDAADAHHDHAFDGEPAHTLAPGEPPTPGWVPLVGAAVFVLGAVVLVTQREAEPPGSGDAKPEAPAAVETVAQPQQPRPAQPLRAQPRPVPPPGRAAPAGSGAPNVRQLSPDQIKDLQKRIQEAKQNKEAGGAH